MMLRLLAPMYVNYEILLLFFSLYALSHIIIYDDFLTVELFNLTLLTIIQKDNIIW